MVGVPETGLEYLGLGEGGGGGWVGVPGTGVPETEGFEYLGLQGGGGPRQLIEENRRE